MARFIFGGLSGVFMGLAFIQFWESKNWGMLWLTLGIFSNFSWLLAGVQYYITTGGKDENG